jgi:hypothetical protein
MHPRSCRSLFVSPTVFPSLEKLPTTGELWIGLGCSARRMVTLEHQLQELKGYAEVIVYDTERS